MSSRGTSQLQRRRRKLLEKKQALIDKYPRRGYTLEMCLAKRRNSEGKIRYCKKLAKSNGRCKLHGSGGAPIQTGMYSGYLSKSFNKQYEQFRKDPNILELKDEVAMLRTMMVRIHSVIEKLHKRRKKKGTLSDSLLEKEIEYMERLGDSAEKISRVVEKARKAGEGFLNVESLHQCLTQIAYLININIGCCPHCHKSLDPVKRDLFESFKEVSIREIDGDKS